MCIILEQESNETNETCIYFVVVWYESYFWWTEKQCESNNYKTSTQGTKQFNDSIGKYRRNHTVLGTFSILAWLKLWIFQQSTTSFGEIMFSELYYLLNFNKKVFTAWDLPYLLPTTRQSIKLAKNWHVPEYFPFTSTAIQEQFPLIPHNYNFFLSLL